MKEKKSAILLLGTGIFAFLNAQSIQACSETILKEILISFDVSSLIVFWGTILFGYISFFLMIYIFIIKFNALESNYSKVFLKVFIYFWIIQSFQFFYHEVSFYILTDNYYEKLTNYYNFTRSFKNIEHYNLLFKILSLNIIFLIIYLNSKKESHDD
jgi:hypothetical protein